MKVISVNSSDYRPFREDSDGYFIFSKPKTLLKYRIRCDCQQIFIQDVNKQEEFAKCPYCGKMVKLSNIKFSNHKLIYVNSN